LTGDAELAVQQKPELLHVSGVGCDVGRVGRRHCGENGRAEARHIHAKALTQTLLKAKSIAYSEPSAGGASGVYFAKLLERLGIAEQMKPKTKYPPAGGFSAELLLTGDAELAVQQKPELLHVSGVEIVGFLPGDLDLVTEFTVAIMTGSKNAETGKALIGSLRSPEAAAVFRSTGLDPRQTVARTVGLPTAK